MLTSKAGRDFLIKKVGYKGLKGLGKAAMRGKMLGGYGMAGMAIYESLGLGKEIYDEIMKYGEGTE